MNLALRAARRPLLATLLVLPCLAAAVIAGCSGDDDDDALHDAGRADTSTAVPEASSTVPETGSPSDAGSDGAVGLSAQALRGQYLVDHVGACGDCHTPRTMTGAPDMTKYLAGVHCFADVNGPADGGCLHSANLTNDPSGLKNATDVEIKTMFQTGVRPDGKKLSTAMPYFVFHNFTNDDADAIVAYLRTVTGVPTTKVPNDPPFDNITTTAPAIDQASIPTADAGGGPTTAFERGRYLASVACIDCHTPETAMGSASPIDLNLAFAGNRKFTRDQLKLPPSFPEAIYSANLTSHPTTGLTGWTVENVKNVLLKGKDRTDGGICPPMPAGPMAAFGGLTEQDALDIATYVIGLPPKDNAVTNGNGSCVSPF